MFWQFWTKSTSFDNNWTFESYKGHVLKINKCHVRLGSYNKTGEHAKEQGKVAEESIRAGAQGSRAGEGRGPGSDSKGAE